MDARRCSLLARTTLAVIAVALAVPIGTARAEEASEPPPAPVDGMVEQAAGDVREPTGAAPAETDPATGGQETSTLPQAPAANPTEPAGAEQPAPDAQPADDPLDREEEPAAREDERAAPSSPAEWQPPPDSHDAVPALDPGAAPRLPAPVAPRLLTPPSHDRSRPRGPHTHVGVLIRHVNEGIRNSNRELAAGRMPSEVSLRALRQNVEELVSAVDALERHRAAGPSVPGGRARFERALRRAVAGAVVLVAALVRSGADTAESERLLVLLRRFPGISPGARGPDRPGAAYAAPGAAAHLVAYTQAVTRSHGSRSSSPGKARDSVAIPGRLLAMERPPDPLNPARIARLVPPAPDGSPTGWLAAAAALLLAVAASGSFASMIMSRWDLRPTGFPRRPDPGGRRQGSGVSPSRRRRTSTSA